jgi:uncharacterized FlaG/YvyC family protein
MDTRPVLAAPSTAPVSSRVEMTQIRGATQTDLAPPVAVAAQAGAEQTRWSRDKRQTGNSGIGTHHESSIEMDRETGDLVYKVIDPSSRATIAQYPYESILKLRAYLKTSDEAGT